VPLFFDCLAFCIFNLEINSPQTLGGHVTGLFWRLARGASRAAWLTRPSNWGG
jgi:hypothetical protein